MKGRKQTRQELCDICAADAMWINLLKIVNWLTEQRAFPSPIPIPSPKKFLCVQQLANTMRKNCRAAKRKVRWTWISNWLAVCTAAQQFMRLSRLFCAGSGSIAPSPCLPACQLVQHRTWTFCTTLVTCSQTNRIASHRMASHRVAGRQSIWLAEAAQFEFCSDNVDSHV